MLEKPLEPTHVRLAADVASKRQLLGEIADVAAKVTHIPAKDVLSALNEREKLGSTAVGQGVALPHARLADLDTLTVLFFQLTQPVDFDAPDDEPVDLVFVLLVPEGADGDHLKVLGRLARRLRDSDTCAVLRGCESPDDVCHMLDDLQQCRAA